MRNSKIYFYLLAIISLLSINTFAQDGTLDQTYGVEGIVKTNIEIDVIYKQKMLSDNSTLIITKKDTNYFLIKNNEDGLFDQSFGENGIAIINRVPGINKIQDFDVKSDGEIILSASSNTYPKLYLIKLKQDGNADTGFGDNGTFLIHEETVERSYVEIGAVKITNDGNYLVSLRHRTGEGTATNLSTSELRMYNSDGTPHTTFGEGGSIEARFTTKILIEDDNIFIARAFDGFPGEFFINKYTIDGAVDNTWGNNGSFVIDGNSLGVGSSLLRFKGFDLNSDGELVCAIGIETVDADHTLILKLTSNGELDATWGDNGIRKIGASEYGTNLDNESSCAYFMPDGKIIWGGLQQTSSGSFGMKKIFLARFNEDGSKDNTFGSGGRTRFNDELEDTSNYYVSYTFLKRSTDEKLVVATNVYDTLYFARYNNSRTYSKKYVSGNVSGTWDVDTVFVNGDITVPLNEELTVKPNTYVYFTGEYKFDVYGTLTAKGTETDSIFFCSDSLGEIRKYPYYAGFWYGITFHSTDENGQTPSSLDYCNLKYAFQRWLDEASTQFNRRFGGGLIFYKSTIDVSNTKLYDCYNSGSSGGVFTSIYSSGNIENVSMIKAGSVTLLSSDVNIESLNTNSGSGFYSDSSKVKIQNSIFNNSSQYTGRGIQSKNSEVEITDCQISNYTGDGIRAEFSSFKIERVLIKNNGGDGAIFIESPSTIANCEIIGNNIHGLRFQTTQNWGTIFTSEINNCVVAKNGYTGIKFWSRNNANITNCTIADNTNSSGWGGIIGGEVDTHLKNCIVWNNGNDLDFQAGGLYTYSIIQGNYVGSDTATTNLQNVNPLFRDAANDDYHLQSIACGNAANSPGIDAGDPNISDFVLDCASAGLGTKLSDIGAYGGAGNWWDKEILPGCHYKGEVSGTWDCETITIDGDVVIPEGDTLIISEAVDRVLISGPYQIKVEGVLLAVGSEREGETKLDTDYIKFQGENWKGIFFNNLNNTNVGTSIIANCRFDYANKMDMTYQGGGAIAIYNSDKVEVKHSLFYANSARYGGAMYIENSNPHIEDCYFELNGKERMQDGTALTTAGGALYIKTSNPYLHKLQFFSNYSISGGGAVVVDNSSITISNILLAENNSEGMGGAIEVLSNINGSILKVVNMTSANNVAKRNGGGTFHTYGEKTELEVINSIIYGNSKVEIYKEGKVPVITYSIIDSASTEAYFGEGCLEDNPYFADGSRYKLSNNSCSYSEGNTVVSVAIDAGHPDSLDSELDCSAGLGTSRADMGYYGGRYSDTGVGVKDSRSESGNIPNEYALMQNYPNPFNPSTTIQFALPKAGVVSLKVYNILGEEVAELINREMNAGFQSINFDASHLSSGLYFYRISAGNFVDVKKMLLLK